MNEIIGPIYYVMASDPRQVYKRSLFLLFFTLMKMHWQHCCFRIGRSTPRRIASSASPTSCRTSGSFPKLLNNLIHNHFLIKGLLHQDPGRFCQRDSSHNGQTCRQVSHGCTRHWFVARCEKSVPHFIDPPGWERWTRFQLIFSMNRFAGWALYISSDVLMFQCILVK